MDESRSAEQRGVPDALRSAVERTLSSIGDTGGTSAADLPAQTLGRASELLDEVARRGYEAGSRLAGHAEDARDVSLAITSRVIDAVGETLRRDSQPKVEGE